MNASDIGGLYVEPSTADEGISAFAEFSPLTAGKNDPSAAADANDPQAFGGLLPEGGRLSESEAVGLPGD